MRKTETQPSCNDVNGLVNAEKEAPLVMHTGQTKGTILPYLSNNCAIGMKMTKEPERDAKNADRDERQKAGMARIPGIDDGKKPTTKSMKSSTKRGGQNPEMGNVWSSLIPVNLEYGSFSRKLIMKLINQLSTKIISIISRQLIMKSKGNSHGNPRFPYIPEESYFLCLSS